MKNLLSMIMIPAGAFAWLTLMVMIMSSCVPSKPTVYEKHRVKIVKSSALYGTTVKSYADDEIFILSNFNLGAAGDELTVYVKRYPQSVNVYLNRPIGVIVDTTVESFEPEQVENF